MLVEKMVCSLDDILVVQLVHQLVELMVVMKVLPKDHLSEKKMVGMMDMMEMM